MRIPGGDLMPARHRRYGGSYGRRRTRRRRVLAVVLLVGLGAAGAWYLRHDDAGAPSRVSTLPACPTATPTQEATRPPVTTRVVLPAPSAVSLTVLNGTDRALLAKRVGDALAAQGFHVTGQANAGKALVGASEVRYGPGGSLAARRVSTWVPGSTVVAVPTARPGSVQVVLGSSYTRLATPAEAAAAARGPVPTATAAPSPSATVLRCRA